MKEEQFVAPVVSCFEEPRKEYILKKLEIALLAALAMPYTLWAAWFLTSQTQGIASILVFMAFAFVEVLLVVVLVWAGVLRKRFVVEPTHIVLPYIHYISKGRPRFRQVVRKEDVVGGTVIDESVKRGGSRRLVEWEAKIRLKGGGVVTLSYYSKGTATNACMLAIRRFLEEDSNINFEKL